MHDKTNSERSYRDKLLLNRRGLLTASVLAMGAGVAGGQSGDEDGDDDPENSPFALKNHDHSGDTLGAETPVEEMLVETLAVATANDTHYAEPGDVQALIDEVAEDGGGIVRLFPNTAYDADGEIHVKPGVMLDFNGATLEVSSDHNGLFMDGGSQVRDAEIRVTSDSWSSVGILLDTSRAHAPWAHENRKGKYGLQDETGVTVEAEVYGINDAGRGLELRDPEALGIGLGNSFDITVKNCEIGVHVTGQRGDRGVAWVNSIDLYAVLAANGVQIKQSGERVMFVTDIYGVIQPSRRTRHVFVNETNAASFTFYGHLWDNHSVSDTEIIGPNITVVTSQTGEESPRPDPYIHGDGAPNQVVHKFRDDFYEVHDVTNETRWKWRYNENGLELEVDGNRAFGVTPNGTPRLLAESDLSQTGVAFPSMLGIDDGTNTASGKRELAVGQADGTWLTMGGDVVEATAGPSGYVIQRQSLSVDGDLTELADIDGLEVGDDYDVYSGDPSVDGTTWFAYDDEYLYVAADLDDNQHVQDDNSADEIWSDDALQVGVTAGQPGEADEWDEIDIALTPDGPLVYRRVFPDTAVSEVVSAANAEIHRDESANRTVYEIALPWEQLTASPDDETLGVSAAIHDRDDDTNAWLEWGSGILGGKDSTQFNAAVLGDGDQSQDLLGFTPFAVNDDTGTIEVTTERTYSGGEAIRVTDESERVGCAYGAFKNIGSTDFEVEAYVNADLQADDVKHHTQLLYLGRMGSDERIAAGVINPGANDNARMFVSDVTGPDNFGGKSISNWAKDKWYRLAVRKEGLSVDVEIVDPVDDSVFASGSFSLPEDLDEQVGIFGAMGGGQFGNLYFDEFSVTPL